MDHGAPDISFALAEKATQADASEALAMVGSSQKDYRCRLNAAGVALKLVERLPLCEDQPPAK